MAASEIRLTKGTTPSAPAANVASIFYSSSTTPAALAVEDESGNVCRLGGLTTSDYRLVKVTTLLSGTTYTPTSGVTALYVECKGGGAGGGAANNAATNSASPSGGGEGAYSAAWLTSLVSGAHTIQIGQGGAGGVAGANDGSVGTDTIFKDTAATTVVLAKGGSGGKTDTVSSAHPGPIGGAGGLASSGTGDLKIDGAPGCVGFCLTAAQAIGGTGGGPGGGAPARNATAAGGNATGLGGGGGGACIISGGASQAGGNGANGWIRVSEYA